MTVSARTYGIVAIAVAFVIALAAPARAQYQPRPISNTSASGEDFHIEGGINFWNPVSDLTVASSGSGALTGIVGTTINAKTDLGFVDHQMKAFSIMARPAPAHKIRFEYMPVQFEASSTLNRTVDFNGQRYQVGLPVNSSLDWRLYRLGYEWDFFRSNSGFGGFIAEVKYTDVKVSLSSPVISEYAEAKAPIPALGGIGRYYIVPMFAVTGEFTIFKLPTIQDQYSGHYSDLNIYGTVNFTKNVGVQGGFRSTDFGFIVKQDTGAFTMNGIYFGVVARY